MARRGGRADLTDPTPKPPNRYGDGWTQWAIKQGYMPAPKPEEAAAKQQRVRDDDGYTDVPRRLDAFDDRMDRCVLVVRSGCIQSTHVSPHTRARPLTQPH